MKRARVPLTGSLLIDKKIYFTAETLEMKLRRVVATGEPINDSAEILYTEKKDGVLPGFDIRTDRWNEAIKAYEKIDKARIAKGESERKEQQILAEEGTKEAG